MAPNTQKWEPDNQNVHDVFVTDSLVRVDNILTASNPDKKHSIDHIFTTLFGNDFRNKLDISKLYNIMNNSVEHSKLNKNDVEVLQTVYARINDPVNNNNKQNMLNILKEQLQDCIDLSGSVVCQQGRIS